MQVIAMPKVLISAMTLAGVDAEYAHVLRSAGPGLVIPCARFSSSRSRNAEMLEGNLRHAGRVGPYTRRS